MTNVIEQAGHRLKPRPGLRLGLDRSFSVMSFSSRLTSFANGSRLQGDASSLSSSSESPSERSLIKVKAKTGDKTKVSNKRNTTF